MKLPRTPSARIAAPRRGHEGGPHPDAPPTPVQSPPPPPLPAPRHDSSFSSPLRCSYHAEPRRSATWPMINTAGCGAKSSPSGGAVISFRGRSCQRRAGPGGPPCGGVAKEAVPGSRVGGRGEARPPPQSCRAEYASVATGRAPGVTDQNLHRSEAWLGNIRHLAGMIRAVVAGPPPQAHHCGCGQGEHLARPWCGAGGCVVQQLHRGVDESRTNNWPGLWVVVSGWGRILLLVLFVNDVT
jgi:hypothetical protein